ncbi:Com family DNA-binding transcriptional regulator [Pseudomonas prosekii]|uniref:Com family DNA-binding transcriptional regulator n=1 Tax=Pseudomonas prosekii TaxID=1148509 RepID=UPI000D60416A|nr:Com family DNA-binding transcriptional regulator [Pseudomonas prosekii]PWE38430.1 Com family DNA-binding transcriptional regulator [Pseudomonas prosekii]
MLKDCRCGKCNKLLARVGEFSDIQIKCSRCGTLNHMKADESRIAPESAAPLSNEIGAPTIIKDK